MYSPRKGVNIPGVDYPNEPGWPTGYVPVPIHAADHHIDYVAAMLDLLTKNCGEKIDIDNLWLIYDALMIEIPDLGRVTKDIALH
ncbi:hypothetical protein ANCDUO_05365 [Ancylostoma duodenale]|uniref:Uncharacterized protein n=1 Tax=Ancylostoma duodenale TaxID=51022 RepID=A0A0C2H4M7_9BILA|nr:hypothetical protein ANCDUO_05365 [Ancylostoma duodenale]